MIFNTCDRQAIHHYNSIWFAQRWLPWYTEQVQQVFLQLSTFENLRSLLPDIEAKLVDSKTVMEFEQGLYYRLQQQIAAPVQQAGQRQGLFSQPALAKEDKPARRYSF